MFFKSVGEEYQFFLKGEGNCKSVEKNIPRKNGIGKKYHLLVNIKATGKNIKLGTWEGALKIWEENQD